MPGPRVAVFCMPERSHLRRLLAVVAGLVRRGVAVSVFTHGDFRELVELVGAGFVDLFARYPVEAADATSQPVPCRYVSFAGYYAEPIVEDLARLRPSLIVYDTFAVIGLVAGRRLGIPHVNVCAGHAMSPATALASLEHDRRLRLSEAGRRALDRLRNHWDLPDASPHSYITAVSPFLNLYCEPPAFLPAEVRIALEPLAFFGSLPPPELRPGDDGAAWLLPLPETVSLRIYASFGSVVWRYYEAEALGALAALAEAVASAPAVHALISLGGHALPEELRARLRRPGVRLVDYVDQWRVLQHASLFLTHHGLNSTHEAIYHRVPMLSYPFFADQPRLAARCRELGPAIPVVEGLRAPIAADDIRRAVAQAAADAPRLRDALARACEWEREVLEGREAVIDRLLELEGG